MRLNIDDLQQNLAKAKAELKKVDPNTLRAQQLRLDISQYATSITEAKRQLNNYLNTGEASLSRLQVKFNQVTGEIKISREEMMKLGKSNEGINRIIAAVDQMKASFTAGKISASQLATGMKDLERQANVNQKAFLSLADAQKEAASMMAKTQKSAGSFKDSLFVMG